MSQSGIWNVNSKGTNIFDGGSPFYQVYETKDNKFISVGSLEPQFYRLLTEKLGLGDDFKNQMDVSKWPELINKLEHYFESSTKDILEADGLLIGTTENLSSMAGATKDFFDRCY